METTTSKQSSGREYWLQATLERTSWIPTPRAESAEADDARKALEGEIDCIAYALACLRARRSSLLPSSLPPDILENVFMFLRDTWPILEADSGWLVVTQVCSRWRDISIHHAPLWTRLTLGMQEVGLWKSFLDRAGSLALRDFIWRRCWSKRSTVDRYNPLSYVEFIELVLHDLHLVRSLHIEDTIQGMFWPDDGEENGGHLIPSLLIHLLRNMTRTAPQLRNMTLLYPKDIDPTTLQNAGVDPDILTYPIRILSRHTPNMERIVMRGFPFAWSAGAALSQLRALTLLPYFDQVERVLSYTFENVTRFLRKTPLLEELVLARQVPIPPDEYDETRIDLPRLRTLRLRGKVKSCIALWRLLSVHPDAHASIVCHSIGESSDFTQIGSCLASHLTETGMEYDTLMLSTVESPEEDEGPIDGWTGMHSRTLAVDLYDRTRKIRPLGSVYEREAVYGAGESFRYPGVHISWFISMHFRDFYSGISLQGSDGEDPDLEHGSENLYSSMPRPAPRPLSPASSLGGLIRRAPPPKPRDFLDKVTPAIIKRLLSPGVDIPRLRTLSLKTRKETYTRHPFSPGHPSPFPWTTHILRPIMRAATSLESIDLSVRSSEDEAVWFIARALKPLATVIPAPALKILSLKRVNFRPHDAGAPQTDSFIDTLTQRAERGCALPALNLEVCKWDDEAVLTRLKELHNTLFRSRIVL